MVEAFIEKKQDHKTEVNSRPIKSRTILSRQKWGMSEPSGLGSETLSTSVQIIRVKGFFERNLSQTRHTK